MDLGTFGEDGGRERRQEKRHWTGQQTSPNKRQVVDPGRVQVKIVCEKCEVGVRCEPLERRLVPSESSGMEQRLGVERGSQNVYERRSQ